jgi:hypothetical protein
MPKQVIIPSTSVRTIPNGGFMYGVNAPISGALANLVYLSGFMTIDPPFQGDGPDEIIGLAEFGAGPVWREIDLRTIAITASLAGVGGDTSGCSCKVLEFAPNVVAPNGIVSNQQLNFYFRIAVQGATASISRLAVLFTGMGLPQDGNPFNLSW